jgi:hypothetical protein
LKGKKRVNNFAALSLFAVALTAAVAPAAPITYGGVGSTYNQDFTRPAGAPRTEAWANGETIEGWTGYVTGGSVVAAGVPAEVRYSNLASSTAAYALYLFRADGNAEDHKLGSRNYLANSATGTGYVAYGVTFQNATGQTLTSFTADYVGTLFSDTFNAPDTLRVEYAVGAADVSATNVTWAAIPSLAYSPTAGNDVTAFAPATVSVAGWADGVSLTIRFVDSNNNTGTAVDNNLAVDDFNFSAVPEPSALAVVGVLASGLLARRRRN